MRTSKPVARTIAIAGAAVFAVATPITQALTGAIAVADADFIRAGQSTLRAAGYAFSIWALIYGWLLAYALYQALPSTRETPGLRALGWPSVFAMIGCALWLIAQSFEAKWLTVAIILASATVLYVPLLRRYPVQSRTEYWLIAAPVSLLAGWLCLASAINVLTVLTAEKDITGDTAPVFAAGGIVLVTGLSLALSLSSRNWVYPLPVGWGLIAAWFAERADRPMIAWLAAGGALAVLAAGAWVATHRAILLPMPRQQ